MKGLHHLAGAAAIAVDAVAIFADTASAHSSSGKQRSASESLPGVLEASGDGIAAASGKLTLKLCAEAGLVITKGGVVLEEGAAYEDSVSWLGLNVYFGFAGCAAVGPEEAIWSGFSTSGGGGGGKTAALAVGTGLELRAVGTGIAFLKGEGEWASDSGESGAWSDEPTILKIGGKQAACDVVAMGGESGCATPTPEPEEEPAEAAH